VLVYFRFLDNVIFAHKLSCKGSVNVRLLKLTRRGQHQHGWSPLATIASFSLLGKPPGGLYMLCFCFFSFFKCLIVGFLDKKFKKVLDQYFPIF